MQSPQGPTVIDIDDQIADLIADINGAPEAATVDILEECQGVLVDQLLGHFGLSREMLATPDGGHVTTLHNFKKGVVANEADKQRYDGWQAAQTERFDRSDYSAPLKKERKETFAATDVVADGYTGASLRKERTTQRDHVVSAHEVEQSSVGHLAQTRERRVETANHVDNKQWTNGSLNASKGDKDLQSWKDAPSRKDPSKTNAEFYGGDPEKMDRAYDRARDRVDGMQSSDLRSKQAVEFMHEGGAEAGKLALRQVFGAVCIDVVQGLSQDVRELMRTGIQDTRQLAVMLELRAKHTHRLILEKWSEYLTQGITAGISGLLSSLVTLLINSFVTTAKNIVAIIREGILAIARSVKTIVMPPPGMTGKEIALEVLKLMAGVATTALGIAVEEAVRKAIETIPLLAPFAPTISLAITGIAAGICGLLVVIAFDRIKATLQLRNKQITDIHRGQAIALLQVQRTYLVIDDANRLVKDSASAMEHRVQRDEEERVLMCNQTDYLLDDLDASIDALGALTLKA